MRYDESGNDQEVGGVVELGWGLLPMRCPSCGIDKDRVVDSRTAADGRVVRRRRECQSCGKRFTSRERLEEITRVVVKKDNRRQPFSRKKIVDGMITACQKTQVSTDQIEVVVEDVEKQVRDQFDHEVPSVFIGEIVSDHLRDLDPVAFVRFASVYKSFTDVSQFLSELAPLIDQEEISDVR